MNNNQQNKNLSDNCSSEKFLTVKEVARRYRTSSAMIYRWISQKCFPETVVIRLGSKILFQRESLERFESNGGELFK